MAASGNAPNACEKASAKGTIIPRAQISQNDERGRKHEGGDEAVHEDPHVFARRSVQLQVPHRLALERHSNFENDEITPGRGRARTRAGDL